MHPTFTLALLLVACSADPSVDRLTVRPGETADDLKADGDDSGPRAELKVMVDAYSNDQVRERLGLEEDLAELRDIWFYDTAYLDLFDAGAILRARSVHGGDDDSTVKLRPLEADAVDPTWFENKGFKCEIDASPVAAVSSCSFTTEQEEDQIEEAADGERDLDSLFSSEQEDFLAAHGPPFAWDELAPLGPMEALVWRIESDQLSTELDAEHWQLPSGEAMLELSIKVDASDADDAMAELLGWLDDHEVPLSAEQGTKTRRALEVLSSGGS